MEKLELKHLAGYLPYELKVSIRDSHDLIGVMEKVWQRDGTIYLNCDNGLGMFINDNFPNEFKPILRPLSDLAKEIEVNGKEFVPAEYFWSIDLYDQQAFELYGTIPPYWKACMEVDIRDLDWGVIKKLYEWHFDIHGLIEKGLAIDINTLKP